MSKSSRLVAVVAALLVSVAGCAARVAGVAVDPAQAYHAVYARRPLPSAAPRSDVEPALAVVSSNRVGVRNSSRDDSRFTSFAVADEASTPALETLLEGYKERDGTRMVVWYRGLGDTVTAALRRHLARHFAHASIARTPVAAGGAAPVHVDVALALGPLSYEKRTEVALSATLPDGRTLAVRGFGVRNSAVHLLWALPLGFVSFPLGFAIAASIMGGINNRYIAESCAQAIDDAAAKLAAAIAASWQAPLARVQDRARAASPQ